MCLYSVSLLRTGHWRVIWNQPNHSPSPRRARLLYTRRECSPAFPVMPTLCGEIEQHSSSASRCNDLPSTVTTSGIAVPRSELKQLATPSQFCVKGTIL